MKRNGLAAFSCGMLLVSTVFCFSGCGNVAAEPIFGPVDLYFSSPALEIIPARDPLVGDFIRVSANVALGGTQNWTRYGVVMDKGNPGDPDQVQVSNSFVLYIDGEYKMWYVGDPGVFPTTYIMFANSTDGITWVKRGIVLSPSGAMEKQVNQPCVIKDGPTYKMWYAGYSDPQYRIFYATSSDGLSWTRQGMVLDVGPSGSYDDYQVLTPFVLKEGSLYRMWYAGQDGTNARLMYVESTDGINWGIRQMLLDVGPPGSEDSSAVSYPHIMFESGTYHLWYTGHNIVNEDRVFYAISPDGNSWKKMGKVLDLGPSGGTEDRNIGIQRILHLPGKPHQMWYSGRGTVMKIFYATLEFPTVLPITASVDFYLDTINPGTKIGTSAVQVGGLSVAHSEIVWQATPVGGHFIYAVLDELDAFVETNETNNIGSVFVRVVANSPPIADAGVDQAVFRNSIVMLDGSASYDPEGDSMTFLWVQTEGFPLPMMFGNTSTPMVIAYLSGVYKFILTVHDDRGGFSSDVTNVTVTNRPPIADAGLDMTVAKRTMVMLDGTGSSDPDNDFLEYSWIQIGGTPVMLINADGPTPTFMPLLSGIRTFELTVDDNDGGIDTDTVQVNVTNAAPSADAGPDMNIRKNSMVVLDGTGSNDPDMDDLTYLWTQTGGPAVTLSGPNSPVAKFTPTEAAIYTFNLTVNDGSGGIDSDSVLVNVTNTGPVANAGLNVSIKKRNLVRLDGTGSYDLDGDDLAYLWTQTSGPMVTLSGSSTPTPTFTPVRSGLYRFRLNVTDVDGVCSSDLVDVNVTNSAPRAYAVAVSSMYKKTVETLDGKGSSDPDMDPMTYAWTQTAGPAVIIVDSDMAEASFTPLVSGGYEFRLTVGDGDGGISTDTVTIAVMNTDPSANAGTDLVARKNNLVTLDATGSSDSDGDVLSFVWTKTSGPTVSVAGVDTATPSFTPTLVGIYVFRLAVDDGDGGTDIDTVSIVVYGLPPVARLSSSKSTAEEGSTIMFDASLSTDSDGTISLYEFDFGDSTKENVTSPTIAHTYLEPGLYTVTLTVVDSDGNSSTTKLMVRINSVPRNVLAETWWLIAIIVILVANVIYFALEWRRWRGRATKAETEKEEEVKPGGRNTNL